MINDLPNWYTMKPKPRSKITEILKLQFKTHSIHLFTELGNSLGTRMRSSSSRASSCAQTPSWGGRTGTSLTTSWRRFATPGSRSPLLSSPRGSPSLFRATTLLGSPRPGQARPWATLSPGSFTATTSPILRGTTDHASSLSWHQPGK